MLSMDGRLGTRSGRERRAASVSPELGALVVAAVVLLALVF